MGTQLPLPAGSHRDPHARLNELAGDRAKAREKIRAALEDVAEKHGVAARDLALAMLSVDDTISDPSYSTQTDLEAEIIDTLPP